MPDEIVVNVEGGESTPPTQPIVIEVPAPVIDPAQVEMIRVTAEAVAELRSLRDEVSAMKEKIATYEMGDERFTEINGRMLEIIERINALELADEIEEVEEIDGAEIITAPASVEAALIAEGEAPPAVAVIPPVESNRKRGFVKL